MSDYYGGSNNNSSLRVPRARNSGRARDSLVFQDDNRYPSQQTALRRPSSRYSLNDQFAATRQEYEFGFDDASSIYSKVFGGDKYADSRSLLDPADVGGHGEGTDDELSPDLYELLVLSDRGDLSQDDIRDAYHRLFLLFYPASYPEDQRGIAQEHFLQIQAAFETLINPERRAQYDLSRNRDTLGFSDLAANGSLGQYPQSRDSGVNLLTSSHLGVRFDARRTSERFGGQGRESSSALRGLDYALGHSMTIATKSTLLQRFAADHQFGVLLPSLTISGAAYGVVDQVSSVPVTILSDRYQPLLPATLPRTRLTQLVESKLAPLATATLHGGAVNKSLAPVEPGASKWVRTEVELESTILPDQTFTTRVNHQVLLPNTQNPTAFDASVTCPVDLTLSPPRASVGARHGLPGGTAFILIDSGDRSLAGERVCRFLTGFAKLGRGVRFVEFPLRIPPSIEAGFKTWPSSTPAKFNLSGNPSYISDKFGSWTAAVTTTGGVLGVGGYARYSRALPLPSLLATSPSPPLLFEAEACTDAFQGKHLALRSLFSVGRSSKLGLEVAITEHSLHLSLHWSRLGQRLTLPLLISTYQSSIASARLIFWTSTATMAAAAAYNFFFPSAAGRPRRPRHLRGPTSASVAAQRHRADLLTTLLAHPVTARQKHLSLASGGDNLVILSAKFGVQEGDGSSWGGEEVADVTIALAALLSEEGRKLVVPPGLRLASIPGFWDPDPEKEKTLFVRYSWRGKEGVVEVKGEYGLVLPPEEG
ncbi:unnamed protein product [Clonostachys rhizophaga]|uniref:J domain-containing protein n=1 Tax=Clonostachys rhizophaga TaxID=160324 RepID=A0A9N9YG03_9HYPO|nr:unnamed protein product [Clonostachys rhizophaga]